ncbi:hypothetical protein ACIP1U_16045 [Cupriavidus sp. NPDC089707]|uniref:hypothetical protein n=1 Tax=Cupriavidus sp. NPDC089707 TaxID=3363963 RepID=UPI003819A44E
MPANFFPSPIGALSLMGNGSVSVGAIMPVIETCETAAAIVALVVILFAALFFIVTMSNLALLSFQLSALVIATLAIAALWMLAKFSHLSGRLA